MNRLVLEKGAGGAWRFWLVKGNLNHDARGRFASGGATGKATAARAMNSAMTLASEVLKSGRTRTITNPDGEKIEVRKGETGAAGGLMHIISRRLDERIRKRSASEIDSVEKEKILKETTAVICLVCDALATKTLTKELRGNWAAVKNGIKAVVDKDKRGKFLLTGFALHEKEAEATETINAVNAQYGNTPAFLGIYGQVGAVYASKINIAQNGEKSSGISKSRGGTTRAYLARGRDGCFHLWLAKGNPNHDARGRFAEGGRAEAKAGNAEWQHKTQLRAELKRVLSQYRGKEIVNKESGNKATIANAGIEKISSDKAISKSIANGFTIDDHFEMARQVVSLFENAKLVSSNVDKRNTSDNVEIERYLSREVTLKNGKQAFALITVKWTKAIDGRRIYTLEALNIADIKNVPRYTGARIDTAPTQIGAVVNGGSISHSAEKSSEISENEDELTRA